MLRSGSKLPRVGATKKKKKKIAVWRSAKSQINSYCESQEYDKFSWNILK
jgi:hypothetical protein